VTPTVSFFVSARPHRFAALAIAAILTGSAVIQAQTPAATRTVSKPGQAGQQPGQPGQKPVQAPPPRPAQVCEYITPEEAKGLLGADTTASRAPSKGLFTSCGYTSAAGDALTVYVSDYGLPSIAKQFFEKTREVLKTATSEDTLGVPAFMHVTAPGPLVSPQAPGTPAPAPAPAQAAAPAGTPTPQPAPGAPGVVMLLALKDHRTVKLEASGPLVTQSHQLPKLRAILTRVIATLPAPVAAPPAPEPPR
jgi:hypothetical protein